MTDAFKEQLTPPSTAEVFLFLLVIEHDDWAQPYHIVNDIVGHTVSGTVYEPYGFEFQLPTSNTGAKASIVLDDIDRRFTASLRSINSPPTVTITLVSDRDMTIAEADSPWEYKLVDTSISGTNVTGNLKKDTVLDNKLSGHYISSGNFPGFFL